MGYTISACIKTLEISRGMIFVLSSLLLQNIIRIPVTIAMCVSGFKLYKSIMKDKRRENIKLEIIRHTAFCLVMLMCLMVASLIEIFISNNLLKLVIQYL